MTKISLSTYTIKAYSTEKGENNTPKELKLDNLNENTLFANTDDKYNTIQNIFDLFFEDKECNTFKNRYLSMNHCEKEENSVYYGELNYGPFGTEHDVVNAINNEKTKKKINKNDSIITPYYFYLRFFKNRKDGLLILETKGIYGIKIIFEQWINNFLTKIQCTHFIIKIEPFIPEKMIEKFIDESHLRRIRYLSYKLPDDKADIFNDYKPEEGYVEYTITIKKGKSKPHKKFLNKVLKGKNSSEELAKNIDMDIDDIKLELEVDKDKRTFTIGNLSKTRPLTDISYTLEFGEDGHRTFESINNIASKYADDIVNS